MTIIIPQNYISFNWFACGFSTSDCHPWPAWLTDITHTFTSLLSYIQILHTKPLTPITTANLVGLRLGFNSVNLHIWDRVEVAVHALPNPFSDEIKYV